MIGATCMQRWHLAIDSWGVFSVAPSGEWGIVLDLEKKKFSLWIGWSLSCSKVFWSRSSGELWLTVVLLWNLSLLISLWMRQLCWSLRIVGPAMLCITSCSLHSATTIHTFTQWPSPCTSAWCNQFRIRFTWKLTSWWMAFHIVHTLAG